MTLQTEKPPTFISAIRRIERLTEEIRRDGFAGFERAQAAYAEIQDLRIDLETRIKALAELRR